MSSTRSVRSTHRRKLVLPVTVIRQDGREKQLAHTLDLTEVSARLGGLRTFLEPGEVIELQRGTVKAKFQVFWMGAQGSAMEGQAGVRNLDGNKALWGANLPPDEPDFAGDKILQRKEKPAVHVAGRPAGEKRWHTRFECTGAAAVRAAEANFPIYGQIKDLAQGGVYVETATPLPVNTQVDVKMNVEGTPIEAPGIVRTSYPMVGMGVSFQKVTAENRDKIADVIQTLRQKTQGAKRDERTARPISPVASTLLPAPETNPFQADGLTIPVIARACRRLADDFEHSKSTTRSNAEIQDLQQAIGCLQRQLLPIVTTANLNSVLAAGGDHS
jgi:hypothetical protein